MIMLPNDTEELARRVAVKTGKSPGTSNGTR